MKHEHARIIGIILCHQLDEALAPVVAHPFLKTLDYNSPTAINAFCEELIACNMRAMQILNALWALAESHKNEADKSATCLFTWLCVYLRGGFVPPETLAQLLPEKRDELSRIPAERSKRGRTSPGYALETSDDLGAWITESVSYCATTLKQARELLDTLDLNDPTWRSRLL